jgi:3-(3-hydroxy-phenyl)propionate hydroxylase
LLQTYDLERGYAADENIRESARSTDFMAPASLAEARLRRAALALARDTDFGKRMVNGGRLSVPSVYPTPLSTPDQDRWEGGVPPGASLVDAPLSTRDGGTTYLSDAFIGAGGRFALLQFADGPSETVPDEVGVIRVGAGEPFADQTGQLATRYDAAPGSAYLLRPDGYVAARFRHPSRASVAAALSRAAGQA